MEHLCGAETGPVLAESRSYLTPRLAYSEEFMRPADVNLLLGDSMKARTQLGWQPTISFTRLVRDMTYYDLRQVGVDEVEYDTQ